MEGEGTRVYQSNKSLTGIWNNNELVTGKLYNIDGTTYEGEWLGGRPHGIGVKTISGGKRYEGMFYLGRPWGKGCKINGGDSKQVGFWEGSHFKNGNVSEQLDADFTKQLQEANSYYHSHKRYHT